MMMDSVWILLDSVLFFVLLIPFLSRIIIFKNRIYFECGKKWNIILLIGCLLFCLYNKTEGDYIHYKYYIEEIIKRKNISDTFEFPYMILIYYTQGSYFLFRFFVWGIALFFYKKSIDILKVNYDLTMSIFILFSLVAFAYVRVSLAISIFIFGFVCFYSSKIRSVKKRCLGLMFMLLSLLFHKSMIIILLIFFLGAFVKCRTKNLIISLCLFPVVVFLVNKYIGQIFNIDINIVGLKYLTMDKENLGPARIMFLLFWSISVIILMWKMIVYFCENIKIIPICIQRMYVLVYLLFYVSLVFLFIDLGSISMFIRVREMAYMPLAIVVSYFFINTNHKKTILLPLFSMLCANIFYFSYAYYLSYLGLIK